MARRHVPRRRHRVALPALDGEAMTLSRAYGSDGKMQAGYDFRHSARWRKERLLILRRDRWTCQWNFERICQGTANTVDHVIAVADGGAWWDHRNLVAACGPCNSSRSPGGRPGWTRSKSQSDGRTVRISHYGEHRTASLVPRDGVRDERPVSSVGGGAVDALGLHLSPRSLTGSPAPTGATQRPSTPSTRPSPFPTVSGVLGRPGGAVPGVRISHVVTSDYSRRTDGAG